MKAGSTEDNDDYMYNNSTGEEFDLPMIREGGREQRRGADGKRESAKRPQMHLVGRWRLYGQIMDMQAVRGAQQGLECLLLSFAEAKMALVSFDAATQGIVTESIHYYEHEELMHRTCNDDVTCALRVDPEGRCVAMRIYDDQLAVLPLVAAGGGDPREAKKPYADSYVVNMRQGDSGVRGIRDFVFLGGYLEPTLALLHEPVSMWAGMLDSAVDSCAITVVSLDLTRRSVSTLSTTSRLPYDCQTLLAVPEPIGGVLILGTSQITHVANGAVSCVSVLNKAAAHSIGVGLLDYIDATNEDLELLLSPPSCACVFVGSNTAAMWTHQGFCFLLRLESDGRVLKRIVAKQIAGPDSRCETPGPIANTWDDVGILPSCLAELRVSYDDDESGASLDSLLLFVGGKAGRSILLEVDDRGESSQAGKESGRLGAAGDGTMDIDAELYGDAPLARSSLPGAADQTWTDRYCFTVYDELLGTGPVVAMEVGTAGGARDGGLELVTCGGNEWRGCLRVQQRHIQPETIASFDLPGAPVRRVWTVRCLKEYNIGGAMQAADTASLGELHDTFMVLSRDLSTAVFAAGDDLQELDRTGFFTDGPTIGVGEILGSTRVVQVHAGGIRVVNASGRETQALGVDEGQTIVWAEVADPVVLVRLAGGEFRVYEVEAGSRELRQTALPGVFSRHAVTAALFRDTKRVLGTNREWTERHSGAGDSARATTTTTATAGVLDSDFDSLYADAGSSHERRRKRLSAMGGSGGGKAARQTKKKRGADSDVPGDGVGLAGASGIGEGSLYAALLAANGDLWIIRLPQFEVVWITRRFDLLPTTLSGGSAGGEDSSGSSDEEAEGGQQPDWRRRRLGAGAGSPRIDELCLAHLGGDSIDTVHIVAVTTAGEVAVYRAFGHCEQAGARDGELAVRFTRVAHDVFAYEPDYERIVRRAQASQLDAYAAWSEQNRGRVEERLVESEHAVREARERAREKQQREEAAELADWGEGDSEGEGEGEEGEGKGGARSESRAEPAPAGKGPSRAAEDDLYADAAEHENIFGGFGGGREEAAEAAAEEAAEEVAEEPAEEPAEPIEDAAEPLDEPLDPAAPVARRLTVLGNVGGYAAVFVAGARAALVVVGAKRYARVHPVRLGRSAGGAGPADPAGLVGVARFHGAACAHGLVALSRAGTLAVAGLAASAAAARGGVEYDAPWPVRTLPVGTAHAGLGGLGGVAFHAPSGCYAAAATGMARFCIREPNPDVAAADADVARSDDQQLVPEHERRALRTSSAPPPAPQFHVDLLSPVTWETIDSYDLARDEHVVAVRAVELEAEGGATRALVCVATGFVLGEDVAARGKVYVFDVIGVVPQPGRPQTSRRLKLLCEEEIRGCISAVADVRGLLAVSVGSKLFLRALAAGALVSVAFLDCQAWVRSLAAFRNFVLIGDLINSLWFAGFQEDGPTRLHVLGRDYCNRLPVEHADFLVLGPQLLLLAADAHGCLHFFAYAPRDAASLSGQRLLRRAEFNLRSPVTGLRRLNAATAHAQGGAAAVQQVCLVSTASGALHAVSLLPEKSFKRLHRINTHLVHCTQPLAALNPREFRAVPLHRRQHHAPRRAVLDADLILPLYAHGPLDRQGEAAQRDGTTPDRVLRDIADAERAIDFF
ncbi:mRNA cleavage and polyadenylation factor subunit [Coemansia thaxteri]|uniref:mRNA cleavage and polyadenylation factor subunit n=1 Tax=Coemansia thaxteri TaxID=2663907 RepID=A0A9W8BDZ7_9FUNG|nr:mRNA cleavage and polyadenylation factor subunit [Coemansia thaxteri]